MKKKIMLLSAMCEAKLAFQIFPSFDSLLPPPATNCMCPFICAHSLYSKTSFSGRDESRVKSIAVLLSLYPEVHETCSPYINNLKNLFPSVRYLRISSLDVLKHLNSKDPRFLARKVIFHIP